MYGIYAIDNRSSRENSNCFIVVRCTYLHWDRSKYYIIRRRPWSTSVFGLPKFVSLDSGIDCRSAEYLLVGFYTIKLFLILYIPTVK